jgi:hypothetical protein
VPLIAERDVVAPSLVDQEIGMEADEALTNVPMPFLDAVKSITETVIRSEIRIEPMRAPSRLAPWAHAVGADVRDEQGAELATGRLVLLYDPEGEEAWDGHFRLVAYASAEMDPSIGADPMLPAVGWSWLTEALQTRGADYLAAGGTVTQTTSTRFGDLHGPKTTIAFEFRGSWTSRSGDLQAHLLAFADLLAAAAGLPPEGVAVLPVR